MRGDPELKRSSSRASFSVAAALTTLIGISLATVLSAGADEVTRVAAGVLGGATGLAAALLSRWGRPPGGGSLLSLAVAFSIAVGASSLGPETAQADFGFRDLQLQLSNDQAGAHPAELSTLVDMETIAIEEGAREFPDGQLRNLEVDMPEGFAGNPLAVPPCQPVLFAAGECPNASVVGIAAVKAEFDPIPFGTEEYFHAPVYNLEPPPGAPAQIAMLVLGVPVKFTVGVREQAPYNVYARVVNTSQTALFYAAKVTLWGNPADSSHDTERGSCVELTLPSAIDEVLSKGSCPVDIPERAFLINPRSCEAPMVATFRGEAWNTGATDVDTAVGPTPTGCSELGFAPEASAALDSTEAKSPAGLAFELNVDDEGLLDPDPEATALSDIKSTRVVLPKGVTINPAQAEGLAACSEADLARETSTSAFGAGCPAASKVGSVEVETPLLEGSVLNGSLFVAEPYKNPFDSLVALYMVIQDRDLGISVKLPARVAIDPDSGQVTTVFGDPTSKVAAYRSLPQLPLGSVRVVLPGGPRSPLVTPPRCGSYEITSTFTPWANPAETLTTTSEFEVLSGPDGSPCPTANPFSPGFTAGTVSNAAGSYSPLSMRITRSASEEELTRFDAVLPTGLVGKIAGVGRCSDAAIAAARANTGRAELALPSCPADSRLGSITAGAGVGPELTYVRGGALYLAGPFAGAPLSVVAVVPAVAGPFDLGVVVTRVALDLDPTTAQVKIDGSASEPIPTILQGIPLALRDLRIDADRPNFTLNPTSCAEKRTHATFFSGPLAAGAVSRFQAAGCGSLKFRPKLKLSLKGATGRSGHPALRSVLTPRPGDANIGGATVLLPRSMQIDNAHINNPCTRVQFNANACPPGSILGNARAVSPLLDAPLEGPVYFRSNGGERELPDVVADLKGQFRIILVGFVDARNARIRTRFLNVPDAPVSRFVLNLKGGKAGLLVNNRNLCGGKQRTKIALVGQNGRRQETNQVVATSCKKGKKGKGGKGR